MGNSEFHEVKVCKCLLPTHVHMALLLNTIYSLDQENHIHEDLLMDPCLETATYSSENFKTCKKAGFSLVHQSE